MKLGNKYQLELELIISHWIKKDVEPVIIRITEEQDLNFSDFHIPDYRIAFECYVLYGDEEEHRSVILPAEKFIIIYKLEIEPTICERPYTYIIKNIIDIEETENAMLRMKNAAAAAATAEN